MAKRTSYALKAAFEAWDEDGNGTITRSELGGILSRLGTFSSDEVDRILLEADKNGDGVIDYQEFVEWLAAPAAPLGATALLSSAKVCIRANGGTNEHIPTISEPAPAWSFCTENAQPIAFKESVELDVHHTIALWVKVEAVTGDEWVTLVCDSVWGLLIGFSPSGRLGIRDPRCSTAEVDDPFDCFGQWIHLVICGSSDSSSPGSRGTTEFLVGSDDSGMRSAGSVDICASGLVLAEFGCLGSRKALAAVASVAIWNRRLQDAEIRELFLLDAGRLKIVNDAQLQRLRLNRRLVPHRTDEENALLEERLDSAEAGNAPGGTLNLSGLKISDADIPRIIQVLRNSFDGVCSLVLSNNYISEDSVKEHVVPFFACLRSHFRLILAGNFDIQDGSKTGEALLAVVPERVAWTIDVRGTGIPEHIMRRLLNDTFENNCMIREAVAERKRCNERCGEYERSMVELENRWSSEVESKVVPEDLAEIVNDLGMDVGSIGPRLESRSAIISRVFWDWPLKKWPDQKDLLKKVRYYLSLSAMSCFDDPSSAEFPWATTYPPANCATGQLMAHFSYLSCQMLVRKPEAFGLRLRKKNENLPMKVADSVSLHSAVECGKVNIEGVFGRGYKSEAITLELKNLTNTSIIIVVPAGTIFQHGRWCFRQNLMIGFDSTYHLDPNEVLVKKLGAYCMNVTCACARGDPMYLTGLLCKDSKVLQSQNTVWDHFEKCFEHPRPRGDSSGKKKGRKKSKR
eukprot:TRINITY_DN41052_c0_g1_i1.p1 TRINITY_DN41052_c0_g1~~TRINITY_DN41052_c0_g1_i1.p1  ORF type:complete len:743 (-),score=110.41 TRINITY_DN41052_c0_g1_i1:120-2348(-)